MQIDSRSASVLRIFTANLVPRIQHAYLYRIPETRLVMSLSDHSTVMYRVVKFRETFETFQSFQSFMHNGGKIQTN